MSSPISLRINGEIFSDWLSSRFSFSLDNGASSFEFQTSARWASSFFSGTSAWQIPAQSPVEILIDGQLVLTGYVDSDAPNASAQDHVVSIGGRSKSGDLVDCSVVHDSYAWTGKTPAQIAEEICRPFGVDVANETDLDVIPRFQTDSGTSAWDVIRQVAEKSGSLVVPVPSGGIAFQNTSSTSLPFELSCPQGIDVQNDFTGRFSDWIVNAQAHGYDGEGIASAQISAGVRDTAVKRYRPKLVTAEGGNDGLTALQIAEWRKARSVGESLSARVTMPDYKDPNGNIWWPNTLIRVSADRMDLRREMIVSGVDYSFSSGGTQVTLALKHPAAYTPKPRAVRRLGRTTARDPIATVPTDAFAAVDDDRETVTATNIESIFEG